MSKYHLGDKFIVEVKEVLESNNGTLYRSNFSTLVFDDYGLDKLQKYDEIDHRGGLIDELKQAEYNKGLEDAWELAKKIYDMKCDNIEEILGVRGGFYGVIDGLSCEEALAKIEAYEREKEIKVGDEVKHDIVERADMFVVTSISKGMIRGVDKNGVTHSFTFPNQYIKKTGKHIDIEGLLRQIGE